MSKTKRILPPFRPMSGLKTIAAVISLAVMVWGVYYPASKAGFIMDDHEHVIDDPLMNVPGGLRRMWVDPGQSAWNYWPLSRTSFWIENRLWGIDAPASHTVNILLHLTSVLILYAGLRRFKVPQAWFISALFALHPVFLESVAWVTERKNVLSGLFYLLSIWSYLSFDENRKWRYYGLSLLLFLCALLSKSSTVMLPVILIFARLALGKTCTWRDGLVLAPFFLLSALSAASSIWFEENYIGSSGANFDRSFAERVAVAGRIPFFYLLKILVPWPLMFVYPKWDIDTGNALGYLPLASLLVLALVLLRLRGSPPARALLLGLGAYLASLFPVLGFFDIYYMRYSFVANHWIYLAALPVLILCGVGLDALLKDQKLVRHIACAAILTACAVMTWRRAHLFQSREMLWRDTLAKNPACWFAHDCLGAALQEQGRVDEAIQHHLEAIRLEPNYENAHSDLGAAFQRKGLFDEAFRHYEEALRISPSNVNAHNNFGIALQELGRFDEAAEHFLAVLRARPNQANTHFNLGVVRLAQGRIDEAIAHLLEALQIRPGYSEAHNNLGVALFRNSDADAAIAHFREALRLSPDNASARGNLEEVLKLRERDP